MKLKSIKKIQKVLDEFIQSTRNFLHVLETIKDKEIRKVLINYVLLYGALNIDLAKCIMKIIPNVIKQKSIDNEFEKLMRQLKKGN